MKTAEVRFVIREQTETELGNVLDSLFDFIDESTFLEEWEEEYGDDDY